MLAFFLFFLKKKSTAVSQETATFVLRMTSSTNVQNKVGQWICYKLRHTGPFGGRSDSDQWENYHTRVMLSMCALFPCLLAANKPAALQSLTRPLKKKSRRSGDAAIKTLFLPRLLFSVASSHPIVPLRCVLKRELVNGVIVYSAKRTAAAEPGGCWQELMCAPTSQCVYVCVCASASVCVC